MNQVNGNISDKTIKNIKTAIKITTIFKYNEQSQPKNSDFQSIHQ